MRQALKDQRRARVWGPEVESFRLTRPDGTVARDGIADFSSARGWAAVLDPGGALLVVERYDTLRGQWVTEGR